MGSVRNQDMALKGHPVHDYIAGGIGGAAGLVVGHPFDTTKVQLQTQSAKHAYVGTYDAFRNVRAHGLVWGLFRGMSWPLFSYGIINSIFFGVYGNTLTFLQRIRKKGNRVSNLDVYLAGCVAGAVQLIPSCPVDLIKVVLQSQISHDVSASGVRMKVNLPEKYYKGPWDCATDIFRQHGIRGCYKGLGVMLLRDSPSYGLYTLTYEYLFEKLQSHTLTDSHGIIASLVAGGTAGTVTWFSIMPFDVIKSRIQADLEGNYKGMVDCARKTIRTEGVTALYKGTLITCLRAFPVNAATFLVYSQILKHLQT